MRVPASLAEPFQHFCNLNAPIGDLGGTDAELSQGADETEQHGSGACDARVNPAGGARRGAGGEEDNGGGQHRHVVFAINPERAVAG